MNELGYLLPSETEELFAVIAKDKSKNATRNMAIFTLAIYGGLRASEIGSIRIRDYDPQRKQIYCKRLKHSCSNTLRIIDKRVLQALDDFYDLRIHQSTEIDALFLSNKGKPISRKQLDVMTKKYCSLTSIPASKHHFHVLKHTRAVQLADCGVNVQDIQWWLGHKKIENTLIYMQFTTKQQEHLYHYLQEQEYHERGDMIEKETADQENQCNF